MRNSVSYYLSALCKKRALISREKPIYGQGFITEKENINELIARTKEI